MIVDNTLVFADSQAVTATGGSTNVIDIGAAGTSYGASVPVRMDIGIGTFIALWITTTEAFNNLTSLQVSLQVDDNAAFSSPATVAIGPPILLANLGLGKRITFPSRLPEGTNERYVRLLWTVVGTAPNTGKILAGIVAAAQTN